MTKVATRQTRRLVRLSEQGIHQTNVLVHDDNREALEALRPHLADSRSHSVLASLTETLQKERPVNVAQVRQISPFRYPGGKTWLIPVFREWLGLLDRPKVFLEPFAGGGVAGLTAAAEGLADRVIMVELDQEVAAVWQVLLEGSDSDVDQLSKLILEFDVTLENVREIIDGKPRSVTKSAFRTIVKNRCQRGGIMAAGAGLVKNGESGRGLNSRWYPETLVKRFGAIRTFHDRITFICGDAFTAIQEHSGATMFIDPPYTAGGKRAGSRLYTHSVVDHEKLFSEVAAHAQSALLTYDDTPEVRRLADTHGFQVGDVAMKSTHHAVMRELAIFKN